MTEYRTLADRNALAVARMSTWQDVCRLFARTSGQATVDAVELIESVSLHSLPGTAVPTTCMANLADSIARLQLAEVMLIEMLESQVKQFSEVTLKETVKRRKKELSAEMYREMINQQKIKGTTCTR